MQLIDLVLQGVRRFAASQKIPFKPGLNLVFGGNESGKTTLFDCIVELLFPNRIVDQKQDWRTWKSEGQSRAGLTFQQGESFYRILKDFNSNAISLSRRGPGQDKFERLSADPSEISALLAEELSLPAYQDYKIVFLESRFWLPSYVGLDPTKEKEVEEIPPARQEFSAREAIMDLGGMSAPGMSGSGMPGLGGFPGMPGIPGMPGMPGIPGLGMSGGELLGEDDGLSWEDKQKRLEELKGQIEAIKSAEEIQFEIDGLQGKIFDLGKEKEKLSSTDEEVAKLDTELEKYRYFRSLPENIDQRIAQYDSIEENRARDIEALDQKMVILDEELAYYEAKPKFYTTIYFKAGAGLIGAGILSIVLRAILNGMEFLQWLAILMAPGVVLVGLALWHFLSEESKRTEAREGLKRLEDQKRSVSKEYQVKGAIVKRLLEQTRCDDTRELKEMLDTYRALDKSKTELTRKKKELMLELDPERLHREQAELQGRIGPLEEKLRKLGVSGMDRTELTREIARLESSLTRARQLGLIKSPPGEVPAISVPAADSVPDASKTQMVGTPRPGALPFWEEILQSGGRLCGMAAADLLAQLRGRANLYLQTLSGKRYSEFRREGDTLLVKLAEGDHEQELAQLGKTAANLVYLSLKFALLEIAIAKYQLPVLLDDPYLVLDENKFLTVAKTLKALSAKTQVIILSSQKVFASEADQALSLS